MDQSVFDEIKSRILRSASNPPPAAVVWAIVEAAGGGVPSKFSASRQVSNGVTTWQVVGLDNGLVFMVDASKPSDDWHGDTMRDDGKEDSVSLTLFKATTLVSARFESKRVHSGPTEKRHETRVKGRWTFNSTPARLRLPAIVTTQRRS